MRLTAEARIPDLEREITRLDELLRDASTEQEYEEKVADLERRLTALQPGYCEAYCIRPRDGEDFVHADECDEARLPRTVRSPTEDDSDLTSDLTALLERWATPCVERCDHSQCPLLRELHALFGACASCSEPRSAHPAFHEVYWHGAEGHPYARTKDWERYWKRY